MNGKISKKAFKIVIIIIVIIAAAVGGTKFYKSKNKAIKVYTDNESIRYISKVDTKNFYSYKDNKWEKEFIKGVNIGAGKPGSFPGEFGITKEDYLRWFKEISDMNANAIRVYTILTPDFYDALYEYNQNSQKPLYLFQGIWVNEEDIANINNGYDLKIKDKFIEDTKTIIDIIHGNKTLARVPGYAGGKYEKDISPYVMGFILGIEWDPDFVINTNEKNKDKNKFDGKYLYTEGASPFEALLCEVGDSAVDYETGKYKMQRPVSFTNWITTDMLQHPNEPNENEDKVSVNMEHIKKKDTFKTGLFASYHIYPYYPDGIVYQKDYANFKDENGKIDTYKAYLRDLRKEHSMPVLVAEFGVPASRGIAHKNIYTGFNQGNLTEAKQGEMESSMLKDIYDEGYAGGIVFAWQDEWFKKTWNTMDFDLADRRAYWNNVETNEQHFGLLAFDPGNKTSICNIDGNVDNWKNDSPISKSKDAELYVKSDEAYVYFMVKANNFDFSKDKIIIPIDTIQNQGNSSFKQYNISLGRPADFAIVIDGKDNSRIMVDPYYDSFYYLYNKKLNMIPEDKNYDTKDSGIFTQMYLCISRPLTLPEDNTVVPFQRVETGKLTYGNGNPSSKEYNSLADFYTKDNVIEVRIPWQLLNFLDPSSKMIIDDLHKSGISPIKIDGIYAGVSIKRDNSSENVDMNLYNLKTWEAPVYHERLKQSYFILKDAFSKY